MTYNIKLISTDKIRQHEGINLQYMDELIKKITKKKCYTNPIVIDRATKMILDGHHRFNAIKKMGGKKIPCLVIDYYGDDITVKTHGQGKIDKKTIITMALGNKLFPPKTTKHYLKKIPLEDLNLRTNIPLNNLNITI